jgi:hypothetical protein
MDLIIGISRGKKKQIVPFRSGCFTCPSFMGRVQITASNCREHSVCKECLPDHVQTLKNAEQCSLTPCLLRKRSYREDECTCCHNGSYSNSLARVESDTDTWNENRCVK